MGFIISSIIFMSCQSQYSESTKVDETSNTMSEEVSEMWDGEVFVTYANDNWDSLKVRSLDAIEGGTDCAAFVSVVLQDFDFDVHAVYTDGIGPTDVPEQTLAYRLFDLGFTRYDDPELLQAGDICFTIDGYYEGIEIIECDYPVSQNDGYFPTHSYIFMEWKEEGSTDWAWVVDNQGERHLRNITLSQPKDAFQYFVRYEE